MKHHPLLQSFFLLLIAFLLAPAYFSQTSINVRKSAESDIEEDVRINKDYPTVYITFDRFGESEPVFTGESRRRVYLRLHNNTKWRIFIFPFYVGEADELGLFYDVARENRNVRTRVPIGYIEGHKLRSSFLPVEPGRFALFSVPREHLAQNLLIRTDFLYSWEDYEVIPENAPPAPRYTVVFRSSDLPKLSYEAMSYKSGNFKKGIKKTSLVRPRLSSKRYSIKQN